MRLTVEDFKYAVELLGSAGGKEVEIIAQLALDLAVSAQIAGDAPVAVDDVREILVTRIAQHRAVTICAKGTIH